jgi:hypothetical protein
MSKMNQESQLEKYYTALAILKSKNKEGFINTLFIHADTKNSDINIPNYLKMQDSVVLQLGYDMPIPIPNLEVYKNGISGTLSFKGNPYFCYVPFEAVYAIVDEDGKGKVWEEFMPESVKNHIQQKDVEVKKKQKPKKELPPYLRVIK